MRVVRQLSQRLVSIGCWGWILTLWTVTVQAQVPVVAEVGADSLRITITASDLNDFLEGRPDWLATLPREEAYKRALDELITQALKRIDLFQSGRVNDPAFRQRVARIVTEELVIAYARHRYEDRYLNEEAIRREHQNMGRVVYYRQFVFPKPADASEAELDSIRAVVEQVREALASGTPFDQVAQEVIRGSIPGQITGYGVERYLTWNYAVVNPRANILFRLSPGAVRAFEEPGRFTVAQVTRIEKRPVPPLEQVREQIIEALNRWYAPAATEAFRREWMGLVDSTTLRWNLSALNKLVAWSNTPGFYQGAYRDTIAQYLKRHGDALLVGDARGGIRISDLPRIFEEVLTLRRSKNYTTRYIQDFLLEALRTDRLAERARALGYMRKVWRPDTPSPLLAMEMVRFYDRQHIESRLPEPTEAALRAFYQAHAESLFYQLPRVYTEIIVRPTREAIDSIRAEILQGTPFEKASHRRLLRAYERTRDGKIITWNKRTEPPYFGELAFNLKAGEIAGPIEYQDVRDGRRYALIRVTKRLEEKQLTFEEARDRVEKAFLEHHRERLAREEAARLRERYPVRVHQVVLLQMLNGIL